MSHDYRAATQIWKKKLQNLSQKAANLLKKLQIFDFKGIYTKIEKKIISKRII